MRIHTKIVSLTVLFLAVLALFQAAAPAARADLEISEEEKAVFSFFRMSGGTPDYDTWIVNSPRYAGAPEPLKNAVREEEDVRLKWGFGTFEPQKDFLKIETEIVLRFTGGEEGTGVRIGFPGSRDGEAPYFPYDYGREWIALIIDDLENFIHIPLTGEEQARMLEKLGEGREPGESFTARLRLRIRPLSADAKTPLVLRKKEKFWLLRGDIAYLAIEVPPLKKGAAGTAVFSYTAPWYLSATEADLLKLLGE